MFVTRALDPGVSSGLNAASVCLYILAAILYNYPSFLIDWQTHNLDDIRRLHLSKHTFNSVRSGILEFNTALGYIGNRNAST